MSVTVMAVVPMMKFHENAWCKLLNAAVFTCPTLAGIRRCVMRFFFSRLVDVAGVSLTAALRTLNAMLHGGN